MKFLKIGIIGTAVISIIIIAIFLGFGIKEYPIEDLPIEAVPTEDLPSSDTELIKMNMGVLFDVFVDPKDIIVADGKQTIMKATFKLNPDLSDIYSEIGVYDKKKKPLVIIPLYTASAYAENGFYYYYHGICDTCLTTKIVSIDKLQEQSSANAVKILTLLGYDSITDIELDKNPSIISKYDKIIVLHNEYVTRNMFDAITSHPNVIYLYPNALYAEISTNFVDNTITLVRGHGYPDMDIANGFDWEFENTNPYEYDKVCDNWEFYDIPNGKMLNCYPEQKIWKDKELLKTLKEL